MSGSAEGFGSVPVNRLFGFDLRAHDGQTASVAFRPEPAHAQEYGVVHGGIVATLADSPKAPARAGENFNPRSRAPMMCASRARFVAIDLL